MHNVLFKMPVYNYACLYAASFLSMDLLQITLDI